MSLDASQFGLPPKLKKPKGPKVYLTPYLYERGIDHFYRCPRCNYTGGIEDLHQRPQCRGCKVWFAPRVKEIDKLLKRRIIHRRDKIKEYHTNYPNTRVAFPGHKMLYDQLKEQHPTLPDKKLHSMMVQISSKMGHPYSAKKSIPKAHTQNIKRMFRSMFKSTKVVCAWCKKPMPDSDVDLPDNIKGKVSHSICPECTEKMFPKKDKPMKKAFDDKGFIPFDIGGNKARVKKKPEEMAPVSVSFKTDKFGDRSYTCPKCGYHGGIEVGANSVYCRGCGRKLVGSKASTHNKFIDPGAMEDTKKALFKPDINKKFIDWIGSRIQRAGLKMRGVSNKYAKRVMNPVGRVTQNFGTEARLFDRNATRGAKTFLSRMKGKPPTYLEEELKRGWGGPGVEVAGGLKSSDDKRAKYFLGGMGLLVGGRIAAAAIMRNKKNKTRKFTTACDINKGVWNIPGKVLMRGAIEHASKKGALGIPGRALGRSIARGAISQIRSSARALISQPGRSTGMAIRNFGNKLGAKGYKRTQRLLSELGRSTYKNPRTALGIGLGGAYAGKKIIEDARKFTTSCDIAKKCSKKMKAKKGNPVIASRFM